MGFVVAVEISTDLEVTEVGESIYSRGVDVTVVAREGKVETGLGLTC